MVLIFVRAGTDEVRALDVRAGEIISLGDIASNCIDKPSRETMMSMTKDQLLGAVRGLNMRITNEKKATKATIVDLVLNSWESKIMPSVRSQRPQASVATSSSSVPVSVPLVSNEDGEPSSGSIVEVFDSKKFREQEKQCAEGETWTEDDEGTFNLLKKLNNNPLGVCVDTDIFQKLKQKRDRCFDKGETSKESRDTDDEEDTDEETIYNFFTLPDSYLKDPSCFNKGETIMTLNFLEFKGDRLLSAGIHTTEMTASEVKELFIENIKEVAINNLCALNPEDFFLRCNGFKMDGETTLEDCMVDHTGCELDITIILRLRGGGKATPIKKDQKTALTKVKVQSLANKLGHVEASTLVPLGVSLPCCVWNLDHQHRPILPTQPD